VLAVGTALDRPLVEVYRNDVWNVVGVPPVPDFNESILMAVARVNGKMLVVGSKTLTTPGRVGFRISHGPYGLALAGCRIKG
jgi:hypothetical protein